MNRNNNREQNPSNNPFDDVPVIFSYTRKQAIEDGVLVDLSPWAKECGFKYAVACTAAVWHDYITPPEKMKQWGQSERGRAHDVLTMLLFAIRRRKTPAPTEGPDILFYEVLFQQEPEKTATVKLKAHCGPGDDGEPVLTLMLETED
jgi:hypothetical protein